jgi:fluoride ion exporter CrcB/FEX
MGFLAFMVIGGLSGALAWIFYPRAKIAKQQLKKIPVAVVIGFIAALTSSYAGQFVGLFQSGQMLEWLSVIVASSMAGCCYAAAVR